MKCGTSAPDPYDGESLGRSVRTTKLSWAQARDAVAYKVYFGTDKDNMSLLDNIKNATSIQSPDLQELREYFWKVDVGRSDGSTVSSDLWTFSTGKMVAYWKFDGDTKDSSGSGHDCKLMGDAKIVSDPVRGKVLSLDGTGDYVDCGNNSHFDITHSLTIAAWIKAKTFDKRWQTILTKGDGAWRLQRDRENDCLEFACTRIGAAGPGYGNVIGKAKVDDVRWHHICGTFDGSVIRLYVDGVEDANATYRDSITTNDWPIYIGENAQAPGRCWNGLIDDVCIYSYALSETEINKLYSGGDPRLDE